MPHFYFHLSNDVWVTDEEGMEFPDLEAARAYALSQARALFGEVAKSEGRVVLSHHIIIADESGAQCGIVYLRDAVSVEP